MFCSTKPVTPLSDLSCPLLCRFSDAGMTSYPRAAAAGVRKAPRHEIAGIGHRRCRGRLWRFSRRTFILRPGYFFEGVLAFQGFTTLAVLHQYFFMGKVGF